MITLGTRGNVRFVDKRTGQVTHGKVDCWHSANIVCVKLAGGECVEVHKKDLTED